MDKCPGRQSQVEEGVWPFRNGSKSVLYIRVATSLVWLLDTGNVASGTEELNLSVKSYTWLVLTALDSCLTLLGVL